MTITLISVVLFRKYSDIEIIEGIRNQDARILNWLYDNYYRMVKDHVLKNSGSGDDVSDVLQDSVIILFEQISENKINLTTDIKGYFFGIVKNVWNSQLRKKQVTTNLITDHPDDDGSDDYNNQLLERIVTRAFTKLKPDQQIVLNMFAEGKSYEEIAQNLDLKSEEYARRKKYLCKEALMDLVREDPEYYEYLRFLT